jgi:hypothetical protein
MATGRTVHRFHARDLHLVMGPAAQGRGEGAVTEQRLHQLIRQHGTVTDHTFEIAFLDPGIQAYALTFG